MYSHAIGKMFVNPAGNLRDGLDIEQILNTGKEYVSQAGSLLEQAKETASGYLPSSYLPGQVSAPTTAPEHPPAPAVPSPAVPSPATPPVQPVPIPTTTLPPLTPSPLATVSLPPGAILVERRAGLIEKVPPPAAGAILGAGLWYLTESWVVGLGSAVVTTILLNRMHRRDRGRQK